jgi:hypothetical protein
MLLITGCLSFSGCGSGTGGTATPDLDSVHATRSVAPRLADLLRRPDESASIVTLSWQLPPLSGRVTWRQGESRIRLDAVAGVGGFGWLTWGEGHTLRSAYDERLDCNWQLESSTVTTHCPPETFAPLLSDLSSALSSPVIGPARGAEILGRTADCYELPLGDEACVDRLTRMLVRLDIASPSHERLLLEAIVPPAPASAPLTGIGSGNAPLETLDFPPDFLEPSATSLVPVAD